MNDGAGDLRASLLEKTLQHCVADYAILERTFAGIDSKAQATFAVAGIFLALSGNLIADPELAAALNEHCGTRLLLFVALGGLVIASLCCLCAMGIRRTATPLEGEAVSEMASDILGPRPTDISIDEYEGWFREQIATWDEPLTALRGANGNKANWVLAAQVVLVAAIISAVSLVMIYVLGI